MMSEKLLNNFKDIRMSYTVLGFITNINEAMDTADVYIPQTNTSLYNVMIGTNVLGEDIGLHVMLSENQKVIISLSAVHKPVIIAVIPNQKAENKNTLLCGEAKIGSSRSFMKFSKDSSISTRALDSLFVLGSACAEISALSEKHTSPYTAIKTGVSEDFIGFSESTYLSRETKQYQKDKQSFIVSSNINEDTKLEVFNDNMELTKKLNDMILEVESFNMEAIFAEDIHLRLKELRESLKRKYLWEEQVVLAVDHGDTDYNKLENALFSIRGYNNGEQTQSISFGKDGIIKVDCQDIIVNKKS